MKWFWGLFALIVAVSCASEVKPDEKLMAEMSLRKLLDYGYDFYINGDYDSAKVVFEKVIEKYNAMPEAVRKPFSETAAWAEYELGFIAYINDDYATALSHFKKVNNYGAKAPSILANLLSSKIEKMLGKEKESESSPEKES